MNHAADIAIPKISICIPTFNRSDLFEKTLRSVVHQTKKPYEIIVVDNCSTDNTTEVVRKYSEYGIKYYRNKENIGFVGNWNKCIDLAHGDYICILHADDLILPQWYEEWERTIALHQEADGFFSAWAFIDLEDKVTTVYYPFSSSRTFVKHHAIKDFYKANLFSTAVSGDLILKKKLFQKNHIGKFKPDLQTETDIGMYFPLMTYYTLFYYNKVLFGYRIHPLQTSDKEIVKKTTEKVIKIVERYFDYIHDFYYEELTKVVGPYELFYKKLIITFQYKALLIGLKGNISAALKLNTIILSRFPNKMNITDAYLYVYLGFVFIKREITGKILSLFMRNLFISSTTRMYD